MIKKIIISAFVASLMMAVPASATIIGGKVTGGNTSGSFKLISPAPGYKVGNDNQQKGHLFAFDEDQNIVLASMLAVNIGPSLSIASGTMISSHYIFFDPKNSRRIKGWVKFDSDVIGIITKRGDLLTSDIFGHSNVTYLNPGLRGLEGNDKVWIAANNSKKIKLDFRASTPGDYIRVITMRSPGGGGTGDVPEPSSMALLGFALLGFGLIRRRRS